VVANPALGCATGGQRPRESGVVGGDPGDAQGRDLVDDRAAGGGDGGAGIGGADAVGVEHDELSGPVGSGHWPSHARVAVGPCGAGRGGPDRDDERGGRKRATNTPLRLRMSFPLWIELVDAEACGLPARLAYGSELCAVPRHFGGHHAQLVGA
jgi:hypothetical protein